MPIHPAHKPGYFYGAASAASRLVPAGPARSAIRRVRRADDDGAQRHAHRRAVPSGVRPDDARRRGGRRRRAQRRLSRARRGDDAAAARPRRAARRRGAGRASRSCRRTTRSPPTISSRRARAAAVAVQPGDVLLVRTGYATRVDRRGDLSERRRRVEVRQHLGGRSAGGRGRRRQHGVGLHDRSAIRTRTWRCSATPICS